MIINTGLRTDIPGFFSKWFFNRIEEEYVCVRNPYNRKQVFSYRLKPELVDCLMFCTKNPKPMISNLDMISDFNQYWHITITPYGKDIEPNVPDTDKVIKSFKRLSGELGKDSVTVRYDPIFINEKYNIEYHIRSFEKIADSLSDYTTEIIISFIDLYEKTRRNFPEANDVNKEERLIIGEEFAKISRENNLTLKTCAEGNDLDRFGIDSSGCMTKEVLERAIKNKINIKVKKARNGACNCLLNNDIGQYNTCNHGCLYCYANSNKKLVQRNIKNHDPDSPILIGHIGDSDEIKKMKQESNIIYENTVQTKLF
ncbi:MAG: DUF1848 domain-containing protein [Methanobrevibacter sp.]|nr:DUF1848 domain-containing protein [Methanobrevibacter sp.]